MKLELQNIKKKYGDKEILHGISFEIEKGICGILGPNGAGKSTMIRMICGLEQPTEGAVFYDGSEISKMGESYREKIGYVPQKAGYYPDFTVYKFLEYIAELKGIRNKKDAIGQVLDVMGLESDISKKMRHLSGGMKQRVSIAQALLNDPEFLILDEPTVGLDPNERLYFKNLITDMSYDKMILLATHIVSDVEEIAERVLILKKGEIQINASIPDILERVKGKVWECRLTSMEEVARIKNHYQISSTKHQSGVTTVRVISEERPCEDAQQAEALLEEAYLSFFEERVK
ncbi:MAG: ATP-binding cassette domain-containing protein [Clostridium sp.]|nr:ATP-binding cassette domain-containing protein [Clostridium sp.]